MQRRIELLLNYVIYIPLWLYFRLYCSKRIREESVAWSDILPIPEFKHQFQREIWLISNLSEFRSLLYYRYKTSKYNPLRIIFPGMANLYLPYSQKIGQGLVIQHGFSTIFNAEYIGKNCQVWHGVTIGKSHSGKSMPRPVIGDNVKICCHATVLGGITIGDNVVIGAGSIVTKSIPANCVVIGNPAKILSKDGKRTDQIL